MLDGRAGPSAFARNDRASNPSGAPVTSRRPLPKTRPGGLPSHDRGAYHLPPLSSALTPAPSAATPRRASRSDATAALPLTVVPAAAPTAALVSSRALTGPVQMWPAVTSTRQRRRQKALESKAPLSLQLEGFIRREHQQYIQEHPSCSRTDTLFIFREALATFVNHFSEYRGVLYLIRDEYDAALAEMTQRAQQMQVEYLESQSDRGLHAMELIQLKESLNATISNQQAQLSVTQGLVHALRDQLTAAEHANSVLTLEMEQKKKTYAEAQQQVKLVSRAMIEETARTAAERERVQKLEREALVQESRVKVLQDHVAELEDCLREQAYAPTLETDSQSVSSRQTGLSFRRTTPQRVSVVTVSSETGISAAAVAAGGSGDLSGAYVSQLLARIDTLEMKLQLATERGAAGGARHSTAAPSPVQVDLSRHAEAAATTTAPARDGVDALFPVVRQWLRMEGVGEAEVEATDVIVPAGRCTTEDTGFLSVLEPVRHRHLSLKATLQLLEAMWTAREQPRAEKTRLRQFFVEWLRTQAADIAEAKALGVNILDACQHNLHDPDCRALLLVLRGYLPEDVVHVCRRRLAELQDATSRTNLHDELPFEDFFAHVRTVCPEKSIANMLQLRFTVYHRCRTSELLVTLPPLFKSDSYFVKLFKQQWLQEVEKFTLQVTEGIRDAADEKHNVVTLVKAMRVLRGLDAALSDEEVHKLISQSCQKPVIDVATADDNASAHLDVMLTRFRNAVLLHRRSPEDAIEE